jgi:site-specific recombinase XerD
MHRWDRLVDLYMEGYSSRGLAAPTVKATRRELDRWGNWMKQRRPRPDLERLSSDTIVAYIKDRNTFKARATLSGNISTMRCFGEFLVHRQIWASNPLRWIRGPKIDSRCKLPRRLSSQAMTDLWKAAASCRLQHSRHLWVTVLCLFYGTGIRRGELSRLNVGDWDSVQGVLRIDGRKTGRERMVPVPDLVYRGIESYLPHRHNMLETCGQLSARALLVNRDGGRLSEAAISRGIHGLARRAKIQLSSVHQFRHSCASDLLEEGLSLPEVKAVLGHQSIGTTVRYLHIADPQKHEAMKRHPLNEWLVCQEACS